ncbi:MarR family winged helix-turn-helix transcriptional regulator [Amycolatopsis sp.]|jgi:DNA-binding MarR family transcriptional regulator|uniref:MarR family winged helix-turn-helix transcriptional regulator n=1 Tax=Amycolatopsis sp. TaxID=37632 RepID=UPI002E04C1C8|nr:MarR family winged helix-turn-helix transcriptional regulator [Amycolatopsis sp.]
MAKIADEPAPTSNGGATWAPATPAELLAAPGYQARRMYQAYLAAWVRTVDATLTGPQFAVLTAVACSPGVDQGSLAASVALDRSTMGDLARRLEERGLIVRETPPSDGRRKLLYLTEEGHATYQQVNARARMLDERLLAGRSPGDRRRLLEVMQELAEHWEAIAPPS